MTEPDDPELLFLHALPLDGSMWAAQTHLLPGRTHAPTLYGFGDTLEDWADTALRLTASNRLIVVGCSVGGSCALEVAALAPDRVAALVLIGAKARHRPDPTLRDAALAMLRDDPEKAWRQFWAPLFSPSTDPAVVAEAKQTMLRQPVEDIARGVAAFHARNSRDDIVSGFDGPIVFVTGAEDTAPGPATCAEQARLARNGTLHVIPACGHYVPLEKPEALNPILEKLIAALQ